MRGEGGVGADDDGLVTSSWLRFKISACLRKTALGSVPGDSLARLSGNDRRDNNTHALL